MLANTKPLTCTKYVCNIQQLPSAMFKIRNVKCKTEPSRYLKGGMLHFKLFPKRYGFIGRAPRRRGPVLEDRLYSSFFSLSLLFQIFPYLLEKERKDKSEI